MGVQDKEIQQVEADKRGNDDVTMSIMQVTR